ncbi:MAG: hypothetical protein LAT81_13015 [Oceanicaulis sp.]|nr:hypothetical protein [Oceanicaulis sp.]
MTATAFVAFAAGAWADPKAAGSDQERGGQSFVLQSAQQEAMRPLPQIQRPAVGPLQVPALQLEDCLPVRPDRLAVARRDGRWKIVDGDNWLWDLGNARARANRTLEIIQHYGITRTCYIGRPNPPMTYHLAGQEAPEGQLRGEYCLAFSADSAYVRETGGGWQLVLGNPPPPFGSTRRVNENTRRIDFGDNEAGARQALGVLRRYGYSQRCFVGLRGDNFEYFRR